MPWKPLFEPLNPTPEETGCEKAGLEGIVCTCCRDDKHFACGVVEMRRRSRGDAIVVTDYTGIDSDNGKHHLAESWSWPAVGHRMMGYCKRRFQKH